MEEDLIEEIKELMKYKPESAGGIMTKEFVALPGDITVEEAIDIFSAGEISLTRQGNLKIGKITFREKVGLLTQLNFNLK